MAVRNIEETRAEAVKRLEALKVHKNVLNEFKGEEKLNKSEHMGILYWLDDEEQAMVNEFEKKHEAVVYHVIHQFTNIGDLYNLLYVKKTAVFSTVLLFLGSWLTHLMRFQCICCIIYSCLMTQNTLWRKSGS